MTALPPGSTIGILGGGQLARMLCLAAARLGLKTKIFAPEGDSPAFDVSHSHIIANYSDQAALVEFAAEVDAITYEFENVPVDAVAFLEQLRPVRPGSKALAVAQDRIAEKTLAQSLGAMTARFAEVNSLSELEAATKTIGLPAVLKTTRMGYDGKGQAKINSSEDITPAWSTMKGAKAILESFVTFDKEISVICARGADGSFAAYEPVENIHRNHILYTSTVPAQIDEALAVEAVYLAQSLSNALEYVGVMGVEFFVGGETLYVNEIAPRVHNSGHWTQNACHICQFEQHIRAVAGWPLGATTRHSDVVMTNLLGDDIAQWQQLATQANVALHLYGKSETRAGRKMGHFNKIRPRQA